MVFFKRSFFCVCVSECIPLFFLVCVCACVGTLQYNGRVHEARANFNYSFGVHLFFLFFLGVSV